MIFFTLGLFGIIKDTYNSVKSKQKTAIAKTQEIIKTNQQNFEVRPNLTKIQKLPGAIIIGEAKCGIFKKLICCFNYIIYLIKYFRYRNNG